MNINEIVTDGFSNPDTEKLYKEDWPDEPKLREQCHEDCAQCGLCSYFAPLNADWGLCCNPASRHHLETVFEHFTCPSLEQEGWNEHSFATIKDRASFNMDSEEDCR